MIFETTRFGTIEVDEAKAVCFQEGLPGFPEARRFVLLQHSPESPFHWLQSMDDPALAFVVMDPLLLDENYLNAIPKESLAELNLEEAQGAAVLVIVNIQRANQSITANLMAPLVINPENRMGKQVILLGSGYEIRHTIMPEPQAQKQCRTNS
ncbi:MAG: flagellar assembly protein FliW [bacterium]